MRKLILLLTIITLLSSCSLFMSKDELLTQKKWMLEWKSSTEFSNKKHIHKTLHFKKSEEALIFDFNINGTVRITEDHGEKLSNTTWYWVDNDKIRVKYDNEAGEFEILELSNKKFSLTKKYSVTGKWEDLNFKHYDAEWDSDKFIDRLNRLFELENL